MIDDDRGGVYIHAMERVERMLLDRNFHNVTHFLCSQAEFWTVLLHPQVPEHGNWFVKRCVSLHLGAANLTGGCGVDYETGYDTDLSDKAHFLQIALVANEAFRYGLWASRDDLSVAACTTHTAAGVDPYFFGACKGCLLYTSDAADE